MSVILDGKAAPSIEERMRDLVFGVPGACRDCLPRRVPGEYVVWISVIDPAFFFDPNIYPYSYRVLLCKRHTASARADYVENFDPKVFIARLESL